MRGIQLRSEFEDESPGTRLGPRGGVSHRRHGRRLGRQFGQRALGHCALGQLAIWLTVLALLGGVPACNSGGDADDSDATSAADVEIEKEEAESARAAAEAANAPTLAKDEFESAVRTFKKAEERNSAKYYKRAARYFGDARKAAEKKSAALAGVLELKAEYEKARDEAQKAGAPELVKSVFEEAERTFQSALAKIEAGKSTRSTARTMRLARDDMQLVVKRVADAKKKKARAESARAEMVAMREKAAEAGADDFAASDMEYAKDLERRGGESLLDGKFDVAARLFRDAKRSFAAAFDATQRAKLLASRIEGTGDAEARNPGGADTRERAPLGPIEVPEPGAGDGDVGDIDVATGIASLFAVSSEYRNGVLKLAYLSDGESLRKDVAVLQGKVGLNVLFGGIEHVGTEDYTLAGNTRGLVLHKARFDDAVRARVEVTFQLWAPQPTRFWELMLHSDTKGGDFYAVQLGNKGLRAISYKDGNPVSGRGSVIKQHNTDANRWLSRRESHILDVRYATGEDGKHHLLVNWDGQDVIKFPTERIKAGHVGFRWWGAKFFVREITTWGALDEDWARKAIARTGTGADGASGSGSELDF